MTRVQQLTGTPTSLLKPNLENNSIKNLIFDYNGWMTFWAQIQGPRKPEGQQNQRISLKRLLPLILLGLGIVLNSFKRCNL